MAISSDGRQLVVGANQHDDVDGIDFGHARVFALQEGNCPPRRMVAFEGIVLELIGASRLSTEDMRVFESITKLWFEEYYAEDDTIDASGVREMTTSLFVTGQAVDSVSIANSIVYNQNLSYIQMRITKKKINIFTLRYNVQNSVLPGTQLVVRMGL